MLASKAKIQVKSKEKLKALSNGLKFQIYFIEILIFQGNRANIKFPHNKDKSNKLKRIYGHIPTISKYLILIL